MICGVIQTTLAVVFLCIKEKWGKNGGHLKGFTAPRIHTPACIFQEGITSKIA